MLSFIFGLLIVFYMGNFLGIVLLSYSIPEMEVMRRYSWLVPVLRVVFFFWLLLAPHEDKLRYILKYIFKVKQKNILLSKALVNTIEECKEIRPQVQSKDIRLQIPHMLFSSVCKAVFVF